MTVTELINKLSKLNGNLQVEVESKFNYDDEMIEIVNDIDFNWNGNVILKTKVI